jgi:tetratricopeptide (TPR) repeat protein
MPKLTGVLQMCTSDSALKQVDAIRNTLANLNDEGKPFHTMTQVRFFRNHRNIRFFGAIHEELRVNSGIPVGMDAMEITILHTGYQQSIYRGTDKLDRNISMIRNEIVKNPGSYQLKAYLADALYEKGDNDSREEALMVYKEVADSEEKVHGMLSRNAFSKVIATHIVNGDLIAAEEYSQRALKTMPEYIDFYVFLNEIQYKTERYSDAWKSIRTAEELFEKYALSQPNALVNNPFHLFYALCVTAVKLEDAQNAVKYATLALKEDKTRVDVLGPLLAALKNFGNTDDLEILAFLEKLYDFNSPKDKVFLARVANSLVLLGLRDLIMSRITQEERAMMSGE